MPVAPSIRLRRASADDVPYVMQVERLPGYEMLVARWSLTEHGDALRRSDVAYFVGEQAGGVKVGFAICEGIGDRHNGIKLKRIAVSTRGAGHGPAILRSVMAWALGERGAPRFWLDVFDYNEQARKLYLDAGLREEGRLRGAYELADGRRVDRIVMSILADEWHPN
jgi:diamine N-acetyltransferase